MIRLRYEPFRPELDRANKIVVGGPPSVGLHLSHWPGNATPLPLKADTSLEIVLKFLNLKTPRREALRRGAEIATSLSFGVDPLLALWALVAPERAQGFTGPLQAAAFSGDFEVDVFPEATKVCCTLNRWSDPERSPLGSELGGADEWDRLGALYRALRPRLDALLGYVDRFQADWEEEYESIRAGRRLLAEGTATVTEFPEEDLAVVRTPQVLHPVARNTATDRLRVATITGEAVFELVYRAETWVELVSRPVAPRIDLHPLLAELQAMESAGTWQFDGLDRPVPSLRCADAAGRPGPSAIPPEGLLGLLRRYLAAHAQSPQRHWDPRAPRPTPQFLVPGS